MVPFSFNQYGEVVFQKLGIEMVSFRFCLIFSTKSDTFFHRQSRKEMERHEMQYKQRKKHLREFNQKLKKVLTGKERSYVFGSLQEYQAKRQVHSSKIFQ